MPWNRSSQYSDEALLGFIVERNPDALETLYDRHAQTIYNLIMRIVRDPAIAEELLQETFWQVWQTCGQSQFRGEGAALAWLCRIARNKSLDQLRWQKTRPQLAETIKLDDGEQDELAQFVDVEAQVEQTTEQSWSHQYVRQALEKIPLNQRLCLELAYFEGLTHYQIAQSTGTPLGTIKTRVRLGLEKLAHILRRAGYQPEDMY